MRSAILGPPPQGTMNRGALSPASQGTLPGPGALDTKGMVGRAETAQPRRGFWGPWARRGPDGT